MRSSALHRAIGFAALAVAQSSERSTVTVETTVTLDAPSALVTLSNHTQLFSLSQPAVGDTTCIPAQYLGFTDRNVLLAPVTSTVIAKSIVWETTTTHVRKIATTVTRERTLVPSRDTLAPFTAPLEMIDGTTFVTKPNLTLTHLEHIQTVMPSMTVTPLLPAESGFMATFPASIPTTAPWTVIADGQVYIWEAGEAETDEADMTLDPSPVVPVLDPTPSPFPPHPLSDQELPSCKLKKHEDRKICHFARCMQKHQLPIRYTTIEFAQWFGPEGRADFGNVTHSTSVSSSAHWGVTKPGGTYWPISITTTVDKEGWPTTIAMNNMDRLPCYDQPSCITHCRKETKHTTKANIAWIIAASVATGLLILLLLVGCLKHCAKRDGRDARKGPVPARRSTDPANEVVETNQSNPAAGTIGRRAEEGRGGVRFDQGPGGAATKAASPATGTGAASGGAAPAAAPGGTESIVQKPATAEHVENARDGTVSGSHGTGRDVATESGSLRGRKAVQGA